MADPKDEYNASKIVVLEGIAGIRKRPAMYIGTTSSNGVLHLFFEVLDNAIDEAMAGFCKNIVVHMSNDGTGDVCEVSDDGRGIPVDIMPKYNKSALEIIMTTIHKGAKFSNEVYKTSGGLHGVGLTVVNALSEYVEVTVKKDGHIYKQRFERGVPVTAVEVIGDTSETGTTVKFKPDKEIFPSTTFDSAQVIERLKYASYLNKGITLKLIDERYEQKEEEIFHSENGILDMVKELNKGTNTISNIIYSKKQEDSAIVEFALQYNDTYEERLKSFVNNIRTPEGGTHEIGFHAALTRAIINYMQKNEKAANKKEVKITGEDVREGLSAVIHVLMYSPEFEGQTKEKLGSAEIKSIVESSTYSAISRYLEENPTDAKRIIDKALNAALARESAKKARELVRKRSIFENAILPGKLADCIEDNPDKAELFIVEGESAGGSSKQGRDKTYQAILPLRGKILNVEKASDEKIFDNAEIHTMITAFGTGINETFNPDNIRYKKIIIMSDADVDGSHIQTLLLTFFYRFARKLIDLGYIYIAQPPLYKVSKGKETIYCYSDAELEAQIKEAGDKASVQRYKGLGEMNPEQLWETTMNPEKRILKRVTIEDAERADQLFTILMGVDVKQRRKFLEEHASEVQFLDV